MVLLVVDTQKALVNDELYNYNEFIDNIQLLIKNLSHYLMRNCLLKV